ncbi:MAG: SDR family oxidoreductase [Candidatus Omnitrophica bacterium]|nr:SDR family oxidoreductase [Candidatus Omnitrophota bacterium]
MPTVFITGANRGLGLEFARQYASDGWKVIATCRNPHKARQLQKINGQLIIRPLDITDCSQIKSLAKELRGYPIDVLINNAAVHGPRDASATFGNINIPAWLETMRTNLVAPFKVTEAFLKQIKSGKRKIIVFISSRAASVNERGKLKHHRTGGSYIYRSSKAALNAVAKSLAFDLCAEKIGVLVLHPGWVRTDMGTEEAWIDKETSVSGMRRVIEEFKLKKSGSFLAYNGKNIPW